MNLVRKFGSQILTALGFLSLPELRIIHSDLKPENILLISPRRSAVKVIDFGSSCRSHEKLYTYIQSRFYRSPEVLLGMGYSLAIDMWSLGCIMVELHTGEPLFPGVNEADMINRMVDILGMPTDDWISQSPRWKKFFIATNVVGTPNYRLRRPERKDRVKKTLADILGASTGGPGGRRALEAGHSVTDYGKFVDLISKMLIYDPSKRITPMDAIRHPFFRLSKDAATMTDFPLSVSTTSVERSAPLTSRELPSPIATVSSLPDSTKESEVISEVDAGSSGKVTPTAMERDSIIDTADMAGGVEHEKGTQVFPSWIAQT